MMRLAAVLAGLACGQVSYAQTCGELAIFAAGGAVPDLNGRAASCATSKVLGGGLSRDCHWVFDFRATAAREAFRTLASLLESCGAGEVRAAAGAVNHPDSFDQVMGQIGGADISLSLKDKGALGQTLVFLRATQTPPK